MFLGRDKAIGRKMLKEAYMTSESGKCSKCGAQKLIKGGMCKRCRRNGFD